jgi:hypothetical protein
MNCRSQPASGRQPTRHRTAEMVARYVREADKWTRLGLKGVWRPFAPREDSDIGS